MSRNNLIAVVRHNGRYYVLPDLNADTEWDPNTCILKFDRHTHKKKHRGAALIIAHDIQRELDTEYGVRELF